MVSIKTRRILGIAIISALTLTASQGFNWQFTKYLKSTQRWKTINSQLKNDTPTNLNKSFSKQQLYAYKYIDVTGQLSNEYSKVNRGKGGRLGYLSFRKIKVGNQQMAVLEGWVPEDIPTETLTEAVSTSQNFRGLIKQGQKKDYLNRKLNKDGKQSAQQFNTYIDLQRILEQLKIQKTETNSRYYIELLKTQNGSIYPMKYTKNDFELPYLTPEKHLNYAVFWGSTTLVGIWGIFKAWKKV